MSGRIREQASADSEPSPRLGLSLLEVVAVIALLGVLLALLLPAVQQSRETAHRMQCQSNLRQLALAVHNYESAHGIVPPGILRGYSWMAQVLPYVDRHDLYRQINFSDVFWGDDHPIIGEAVPLLLCPSDGTPSVLPHGRAGTNYAGNFGTGVLDRGFNGIFQNLLTQIPGRPWSEGPVRWRDISDGTSSTAMLSEALRGDSSANYLRVTWNLQAPRTTLPELRLACTRETPRFHSDGSVFGDRFLRGDCWLNGSTGVTLYNHASVPMSPSCFNGSSVAEGIYGAGSKHIAGVNLVFADGHLQFVSRSIDANVWTAWGSRNGNEPVSTSP